MSTAGQALLPWKRVLACVAVACAAASEREECIVSRRLPLFGLRVGRQNASAVGARTLPASRASGGACHMGRLLRVQNPSTETAVDDTAESTQMCTHNDTVLTCAVLVQNRSHPESSTHRLRTFAAHKPSDGVQDPRATHGRSTPCSACAQQEVNSVLTRFSRTTLATGRRQLSLGVRRRLSTERLLASQLHRAACNTSETCAPLHETFAGACSGRDACMQRGAFMSALLNRTHFGASAAEHTAGAAARGAVTAATDALWTRSWVWCRGHGRSSARFDQCSGSVDKAAWLDPKSRAQACARHIPTTTAENSISVDFCLLHAKTAKLCAQMFKWRSEAEKIISRAAGRSARTDFFYSPTTFDLREQQFVYDSVLDFYASVGRRSCAPSASANAQQQANYANMGRCASVHLEPLLVIVEQLREGKRILLLIGYHVYRVQFYLVQLLVSATVDTAAALASAGTDTVGRVADGLLREVMALMQVIGSFVDLLTDSIMELAMSRGVGKTIKDMLVFMCQVVELIHNTLWSYLLCPVLRILLLLWEFMIGVLDALLEIVRIVLFGAPEIVGLLDGFISVCRDMIAGITRAIGTCETKSFNCVLEPVFGGEDTDFGALPMPTRCWTSYLTFFGDNQQLSCSKADTCKLSRVASSSERRVCGACPAQSNDNVLEFACDYISGICTCGVPELSSTSCFTNNDCMTDEDATCRLINDDLEISAASVQCAQCQYQQMCYETSEGGVCACGARQRKLHTCSSTEHSDQQALVLRLNDLCLYTATVGVVEFGLSTVIPCQELDSSLSSCAWAVDVGAFFARGSRRVRRRLLAHDGADGQVYTYRSMDSVCRDALLSDALRYTRASCQEAFDASNATLALLGLERQLPPCALCSFADALEAARHNPVAVLRLLSPRAVGVVLQRHGPFLQAARLGAVLHDGLRDFSALLARRNGSQVVHVERRGGRTTVLVEDAAVQPHVARALESLLESVLEALPPGAASGASASGASASGANASGANASGANASGANASGANASGANASAGAPPLRRLLLFRELVLAVEERVRNGWGQAGRLHEAFSQSIELALTYDYDAASTHDWPPVRSAGVETCNELHDLLYVCIEVAQGVLDGWLTLTHMRDSLQGRPVDSLSDAWPALLGEEVTADETGGPPDDALALGVNSGDDVVMQTCTEGAAAGLRAIGVQPRVVYDIFFSVASAANASFSCPYHAVQTCSRWRRRLWHSIVIVLLWFSAAAVLVNALGISFLSSLLVPFFSLVVLQLCYGYTWTCAPMVPVCAWQDFSESVSALLPLSLEVPAELKRLDPSCLVPDTACLAAAGGSLENCLAPRRYPHARCLKSCRDAPFSFRSWQNVVAWWVAEAGPWADEFAAAHAHSVPLLDHEGFLKDVRTRARTLVRTSADSVSAHRVCAALSAYMLLPYVFILLLVLAFVASLAQALATQLLPFFLLLCTLYNAVAASADEGDEERMRALESSVRELQAAGSAATADGDE
jgi:hypothetical protein